MKRKQLFCVCIGLLIVSSAFAATVELDISISNPYLLADQRQSVFLKVGLTGFEAASNIRRPGANVAIVLDRSGSMEGEKIRRAKEAALMAVDMLKSDDIVSIVTYSDTVSVLVPATRVTERSYIRSRIESIYADGSTALFAGVSKGAEEVEKYFSRNNVNRVILLSDGLANVGPDSPYALGRLGASLKKSGISVTTIGLGLGYNEDLMVELASRSDGNHAFVENYNDLARIFRYEFSDILSVVAQDVVIEVTCYSGTVPVRVLGRDAEIIGNKIYTSISQLYSSQEKYLMVELDIPPQQEGANVRVASVDVLYDNMETKESDRLSALSRVAFTRSEEKVEQEKDADTIVEAVKQIAVETKEEAIKLRDKGDVEKARKLLEQNTEFLYDQAESLGSEELEAFGAAASMDAEVISDDEEWNASRKRMKAESYEVQNQQNY